MNSSNLTLIALLFLLMNNNAISTTQMLLLITLLSTACGELGSCLCGGNRTNS